MASEVGPVPIHVPPDNRMLLEGILNMSARTKDQPEATEDTITLVNAKTLFDAPALRALRGGV
jgi:hypothetical protein